MSAQTATGFLAVLFFLQLQLFPFSDALITNNPDEAFDISREAYQFFVPVINNWRFLSLSTDAAVPFDEFQHSNDFRPPNENVIYSISWLDVRNESRVITVPPVENRYYSLHLIDGYTHNIGIVSARTFPNPTQSGNFVVAGPGQCEPPSSCVCDGINEEDIFYSESVFVLALIRIQAFSQLDIPLFVAPIQQQFGIAKLSVFCGGTGPVPDDLPFFFFVPLQASRSTEYFFFVNLIWPVMFRTIHPTEVSLFQRFERIGVANGEPFPPPEMSDQVLEAIRQGIREGSRDVRNDVRNPSTGDERGGWQLVIDPPQFGNRSVMQGRYLTRAAAARGGIYGLDPEEAFYPVTRTTKYGFPLNGRGNTPYYMIFHPLRLPPVFGEGPLEVFGREEGLNELSRRGFWSITMHTRFNGNMSFVPNPINRFSIGSRELSTFCYNEDGSFPIIMQAEKPEEPAFARNWLPAPDGSFLLLARLYAPRPRAIRAPYLPPPVRLGLPREVPTDCFPPLQEP